MITDARIVQHGAQFYRGVEIVQPEDALINGVVRDGIMVRMPFTFMDNKAETITMSIANPPTGGNSMLISDAAALEIARVQSEMSVMRAQMQAKDGEIAALRAAQTTMNAKDAAFATLIDTREKIHAEYSERLREAWKQPYPKA